MNDFGERLRKLRIGKDITQDELGRELGVGSSTVGKYERVPNSYPSVDVLIKISNFFSVSIDYLLKGTETVPAVENNINGTMSNSPFIQANHGGVVIHGDKALSPEGQELLHIYENLGGRERLKLLNYAISLEEGRSE